MKETPKGFADNQQRGQRLTPTGEYYDSVFTRFQEEQGRAHPGFGGYRSTSAGSGKEVMPAESYFAQMARMLRRR